MSTLPVCIGVLGIQGSVQEHFEQLKKIGVSVQLVKSPRDLEKVNGLIIPGGESTTISKLLKSTGLDKAIRKRATLCISSAFTQNRQSRIFRSASRSRRALATMKDPSRSLAIWGTCAGAILLAKKVTNGSGAASRPPATLALMDIDIERNAYGSQTESFETNLSIDGFGKQQFHAIFIRAPKIRGVSQNVQVLARHLGKPVMLLQKNLFATMFHPELTGDTRVHEYFVKLVQKYANSTK